MSASTGIIKKSYVSALDPMLDTRVINKLITDVYNEDDLSDILGYGNKKMPTVQPVYYTFYDDPLVKAITVTSNTGTGTTQVTPALNAATSGYTRVGDLVIFANNNVGIVYDVSTSSGIDTLTIDSVSGANLTLGATDTIPLFSNAKGEGQTTGANIRYGLTKQSNKYQEFNAVSRITDVQNASTVEVDFQGQPKYFFKDQWEKRVKLKSDINAAFIGGDMSATSYSDTNPTLVDPVTSTFGGGGAVQTTRGINKYISLYGTSLVTNNGGVYTQGNVDDAIANLIAVRAPKKYWVWGSTLAKMTTDTYYKALGSSGVQSVRIVIDGRELDMNVDRVNRGKFELNYAVMPILDHPVTFGGTQLKKCQFWLPFDNKVKVEGGGSDDQIRVRYVPRQSQYGDDMINEIHYGAYSPVNPNGNDSIIGLDYRTMQGLEFLAPQHAMKQQVIN